MLTVSQESSVSRTAAALRTLDAQESHATQPLLAPHRWQGARPLELGSRYASHASSSMDDAGLPPQTEDEAVEVGGSTLAALLLEPLHQPQAHSGLLFGVVKHAPAAIASRNSMGSYNGEDDDGPTKTTAVLSHARGTDPSLATSVAPEEARVVGLWVARPAAPPVPTLRDVAAVEKLRETARDAILLVVTCEGASARYRCFVGGHAVRPCRVRVRAGG